MSVEAASPRRLTPRRARGSRPRSCGPLTRWIWLQRRHQPHGWRLPRERRHLRLWPHEQHRSRARHGDLEGRADRLFRRRRRRPLLRQLDGPAPPLRASRQPLFDPRLGQQRPRGLLRHRARSHRHVHRGPARGHRRLRGCLWSVWLSLRRRPMLRRLLPRHRLHGRRDGGVWQLWCQLRGSPMLGRLRPRRRLHGARGPRVRGRGQELRGGAIVMAPEP